MTPLELENRQLRERLDSVTDERDELRRRLVQRQDEAEHALIMATFNFPATEAHLVQALYSYDRPVSRDALMDALYADRGRDREPDLKILDVFVCKVRKKMGAVSHIKNIWGRGYELTESGRAALTARIEAIKARRAAA